MFSVKIVNHLFDKDVIKGVIEFKATLNDESKIKASQNALKYKIPHF